MSIYERNKNGVPQYPKGHPARLLVALAAIHRLKRPTAQTVSDLTGLSKSKIDEHAINLNRYYGTEIIKNKAEYRLLSWGKILNRKAVLAMLVEPIEWIDKNETIVGYSERHQASELQKSLQSPPFVAPSATPESPS